MAKPRIETPGVHLVKEGDMYRIWYLEDLTVQVNISWLHKFPAGRGGLVDKHSVLEGKVYVSEDSVVRRSRIKDSVIVDGSKVHDSEGEHFEISDSKIRKSFIKCTKMRGAWVKDCHLRECHVEDSKLRNTEIYSGTVKNIKVKRPTYLHYPDIESEVDIERCSIFEGLPDFVFYRNIVNGFGWCSKKTYTSYIATLKFECGEKLLVNKKLDYFGLWDNVRKYAKDAPPISSIDKETFDKAVLAVLNDIHEKVYAARKEEDRKNDLIHEVGCYMQTEGLEETASKILAMPDYNTDLTEPDIRVLEEYVRRVNNRSLSLDKQMQRAAWLVWWASRNVK